MLGHNQLSGEIPAELGSLANLEWLFLHNNRLTGGLPTDLGGLSSLTDLSLWGNRLSGEIPAEVAGLPQLVWADLANNRFTGSIPSEFGGSPNLNGLILHGNELDGGIPPELGQLANLGHLDLGFNHLTGGIPVELGSCSNLGFLNLGGNRLTGPIPSDLGGLTNLGELYLNDNLLEGSFPPDLGGLVNLGQLHLQNNNLTGELPPEIGGLASLGHLDLGQNHLSGSIPAEIGDLVNLGFLNLSNNLLSGEIPPEIGTLVNLGELYLAWNRIGGEMPPEIGDLASLWGLDLSNNRFEGQIPADIGDLGNLQWMNFRSNQLMGPIPTTITNLASLGDFSSDLQMNGLYSDDPGVVAFLDQKCGSDWKDVQTIAPSNFGAIHATGVSVTLGWDPIPFNWNAGGYDIFVSESPTGPFLHYGRAVDKNAGSWTLFGLLPGTTWYFKICSITEAGAENQNTVISELTPAESISTTAAPSIWYASNSGLVGNDCATPATPCPTISAALDVAGPGEVVHVAAGTYTEIVRIDEPVRLVGEDAGTTIIQGHGWSPVIDIFPFAHASISGFTIRNGQVQFGAGIYVGWRALLELEDAIVTMNQAEIMGGGVYVECEGGATLDGVTIAGNSSNERGGGLSACGGTFVNDSFISDNTAPWGGGVAIQGATTIARTTITDNTATAFTGGGIFNEGRLTLEDSTISGNAAPQGGGLANMQHANTMAANTTVSENHGGGVLNSRFAMVGLDSCTIAGNIGASTDRSGVTNWDVIYIHNTILEGNTPANCANPVFSLGYNLDSDSSCELAGPSDLSGVSAQLGPLADNGGPTWTHALAQGSPAIDTGDPAAALAADQRGMGRPVDGDFDGAAVVDIGAVEFHGRLFEDGFEDGSTSMWSSTTP
jgi:Leucine-rich repeat (LRR) protein